jgi:hypothetical protein
VSPSQPQARFAAAYQLMASYLVWDIHDLVKSGQISDPAARARLEQFTELLDHAMRATHRSYPAGREAPPSEGSARAERTKRLVSRNRDEELLKMIIAARGDEDRAAASHWTERAHEVLNEVESRGWKTPKPEERVFLEQEVEPFLRRLQRLDQLDAYRPGKRSGLTRR